MLSPLPRRSVWAYCFAHFTQPYQPSPKGSSGRPAHCPFRGLLGVHSRYGLHTRAVTVYRDTLSEGFSHFVTSMTAPVASGWSGRRVGLAPTGKRRLFTAHTRCGHFALPIEDLLINGPQELEGAVNQKQRKHLSARCQCGKVKFEAAGPPILTCSCYCTSCQEAGR